ncbi:MAG: TonB-dependent receptor [Puniceicoccaceae bacterium]|nr:MAG: TonB-dependent receptor [Puniceicoccaceae bacterium]
MKTTLPALVWLCLPFALLGQETNNNAVSDANTPASPQSVQRLDTFTILGSPDQVFEIPGSASFIDLGELSSFNYDNIDQAIRRVPGVYVRTEDGYGLFPNISIRGVGSMRSSNITVMEDGVLSAPAPYSNPAAYYTPTTGRMRGLEVIKGSSQVKYGPQITGGALNYLSTEVPQQAAGYAKFIYGTDNDARAHLWYGDRFETELGTFGYLGEIYYRQTDGFKQIDGTAASSSSSDTGFTKFEPMVKLFWEPKTSAYQRFEFKAGYTDMDADETYLGLTTEDFRRNPNRRYAASRFDTIETENIRTYLRHIIEPNVDTRISTTAYYNDFSRAWYKLHDVRGQVITGGVPQFDGNGDPILGSNTNLSEALASPGSSELAVLKGEGAGSLRVRNNNREYKSYGIQTVVDHNFDVGATRHDIQLGIRLHEDYEDRFQNQDVYTQNANGGITNIARGAPGSQDDRRGTTTALAVSLSDQIQYADWTFTPGVRWEHVRYKNNNRMNGTRAREELDVFAYGIGALYKFDERHFVFGNVFRGFALPSPGAATGNDKIQEETSDAFELGYRYRNADHALQAEVIFFHTRFNDLIVPDNIGGAGAGGTENVGKARTQGIELSIGYDFAKANNMSFSLPAYVAFTYTDAELRNKVDAGGGGGAPVESIFAGGRKGAALPYVPDYQISFGLGFEKGPLGLYADAVYVDSTYGTASNVSNELRPDGTNDARFGKNDAYFLLDLSGSYQLTDQARLLIGVNNALDREYLASRLPHGPRPGQGRFWYGGVEFSF